ncbi:hypothetical protein ACFL4C_02655 [Candidatus Omnitrophota bacterium]
MSSKTDRFIVIPQVSEEQVAYHDMALAEQQIGHFYNYMDNSMVEGADITFGIREVKQVPPEMKSYIEPHKHDVSQLYVILGDLTVEFILEGERHEVTGPSSVFIKPGMMHTTCPIRGSGSMLVYLSRGKYK